MGDAGSVLGDHPLAWAEGMNSDAKKQAEGMGPGAIPIDATLGISGSVLNMLNGIFSEPSYFYYETVKQLHGEKRPSLQRCR